MHTSVHKGSKRSGIEWFLEKCRSRKILALSENLASVFDGSQVSFWGHGDLSLSLGLEF